MEGQKRTLSTALLNKADVDDVEKALGGAALFEFKSVVSKEPLMTFDGLKIGLLSVNELPEDKVVDFYCSYCINTLEDDELVEDKSKGRGIYGVLWDFTADEAFCKVETHDEESPPCNAPTYHIFHAVCLAQQIRFWKKQRSHNRKLNIRCPVGCRSITLEPPRYLLVEPDEASNADDNMSLSSEDEEYYRCSLWRLAGVFLRSGLCLLTAFMVWYYGWLQRNTFYS